MDARYLAAFPSRELRNQLEAIGADGAVPGAVSVEELKANKLATMALPAQVSSGAPAEVAAKESNAAAQTSSILTLLRATDR